MKKKRQNLRKKLNKMEINNLLDKEFKIMVKHAHQTRMKNG